MQRTSRMTMGPAAIAETFILTNGDFTTSGTSQTVSLLTLPKGSIVKGVYIKPAVLFAGGGNATVTLSVGSTTGGVAFFAPAFDVHSAVADTTAEMVSGWKAATWAADTLTATLNANSDVSTLTTSGTVYVIVEILLMEDLTATGPSGNSSSGGLF